MIGNPLKAVMSLDLFLEVIWHTDALFHDEAEEEIRANVIDVNQHLIGMVWGHRLARHQCARSVMEKTLRQIKGWTPGTSAADDESVIARRRGSIRGGQICNDQ